VQYVGQQLDHGTYRPINSCALWWQTINDGHYHFIVTTPKIGADETVAPPENLWTSTDPKVRTVISSGPAAVYEITGPLDPALCAKLGARART
jgi:hypothetical protein